MRGGQRRKTGKLFLLVGIATSYFDYLTYPLVALMVPMTIFVAFLQKYGRRTQFTELVKGSFEWALGYLGMWFGKWMIATMLTSVNVFDDAADGIEMRSSMVGGYGEKINMGGILVRNIGGFVLNPFTIVLIIYLIYCLRKDIKLYGRTLFSRIKTDICLVILFFTPFVWYCVASNHAYTHVTTECKMMMISCLVLLYLLDPKRLSNG